MVTFSIPFTIILAFPHFASASTSITTKCLDIVNDGCIDLKKFLNSPSGCQMTSAFGPMESRCVTPGNFMFNKAITKHGEPEDPVQSVCSGEVVRTGKFLHNKTAFTVVTGHDFTETCTFQGKEYKKFEIYYGHTDGGKVPPKGQSVGAGEIIGNLEKCHECLGFPATLLLLLKIGDTFINPISLFPKIDSTFFGQLRYIYDEENSGFEVVSHTKCRDLSFNRYEVECGAKKYIYDFNLRKGFSAEVDNPPPHAIDTSKPFFRPYDNPELWGSMWYNSKIFIPKSWLSEEKCCTVTMKDVWDKTRWSDSMCSSGLSPVWKGVGSTLEIRGLHVHARTVALSRDGKVMGIMSIGKDPKGLKGRVRVYMLSKSNVWIQKGQTFKVDETKFAGKTMSLSANGDVLAFSNYEYNRKVGRVRAFSFDDGSSSWVKMGGDINGMVSQRNVMTFGYSIALSKDGLTLGEFSLNAISRYLFRVRVYKFVGSKWVKVGEDVTGSQSGGFSSFSLSGDGRTFAVGSTRDVPRVYSLSAEGTWLRLGHSMNGSSFKNQYGSDVGLSENGRILAVGYRSDVWHMKPSGAEIFTFEENTWTRVGQVLKGVKAKDEFGYTVGISDDGQTVVSGDRFGSFRVFVLDGNMWVQKGEDIVRVDRERIDLDISGDGLTVATVQEDSVKVFTAVKDI